MLRPVVVVGALLGGLPLSLPAQSDSTRIIECRSSSTAEVRCYTGGRATRVRLVRDRSFNFCALRGSWGYTASHIWVANKCGGDFEVSYATNPSPGDPVGMRPRRIVCGTRFASRVRCETDGHTTEVRLVREMGGSRCRKGSNWGYTESYIWTERGCRGEFEPTYGDPAWAPVTLTRTLTCGTTASDRVHCGVDGTITGVRLLQDLNGDRCRIRATWGHTDSTVWAGRGCIGQFEVTYRRDVAPSPTTRVITCGATSDARIRCKTDGRITAVRLRRSFVERQCREGSSWGHGEEFIWTSHGCVGEFEVTYAGSPPPRRRTLTCGQAARAAVKCESEGEIERVRLTRELSHSRCRQGYTWGYGGSSIWTSEGCRGEFEVTYQAASAGGRDTDSAQAGSARMVRCGNPDGESMTCAAAGKVADARLVQDLSNGRCAGLLAWGHNQRSVWVKRGCYGEFEVTYE